MHQSIETNRQDQRGVRIDICRLRPGTVLRVKTHEYIYDISRLTLFKSDELWCVGVSVVTDDPAFQSERYSLGHITKNEPMGLRGPNLRLTGPIVSARAWGVGVNGRWSYEVF